MSELKTNKISTNDQNNVAIDNALGLKSYTTTQRDALTSVAGDLIYNTTDSKVQVYNGTGWGYLGGLQSVYAIESLVIAGGGAGGGAQANHIMGGGGNNGNGGSAGTSGAGGSGVVILRYPGNFTATLAGGATSTDGEQTDGADKYIQIEATGTISWS